MAHKAGAAFQSQFVPSARGPCAVCNMDNWTQVGGAKGPWPEYEAKQPWMGTRMCLGDAGTNTQHLPRLGTTRALSSCKVMAKFGFKAY